MNLQNVRRKKKVLQISCPPPPQHVSKILYTFQKCTRLQPNSKDKGKAITLQAWNGPEGSRKLRFPDYMTTAQDGGKVVSPTHRPPLPPGNVPGTHFC